MHAFGFSGLDYFQREQARETKTEIQRETEMENYKISMVLISLRFF
jgi:hypothetical protein